MDKARRGGAGRRGAGKQSLPKLRAPSRPDSPRGTPKYTYQTPPCVAKIPKDPVMALCYSAKRLRALDRLKIFNAFFGALAVIGLIDPSCTLEKVCTPGYTATVRPGSKYTTELKKSQMAWLGLGGDASQYEEDHIISLELCGAPKDPRNLIPEPWSRARAKDVMETRFHRAVCKGQMSLEDAQNKIVEFE